MTKPMVVVAETGYGELTVRRPWSVSKRHATWLTVSPPAWMFFSRVNVAPIANELAAHGADRVTVVEHEALAQFSADGWFAALAPILQKRRSNAHAGPGQRVWRALVAASIRPLADSHRDKCIRSQGHRRGLSGSLPGQPQRQAARAPDSGSRHRGDGDARPGVRGVGPPRSNARAEVSVVEPALDPSRSATGRYAPFRPIRMTWTWRRPSGSSPAAWASAGRRDGGTPGTGRRTGGRSGRTRVVADRGWLRPTALSAPPARSCAQALPCARRVRSGPARSRDRGQRNRYRD